VLALLSTINIPAKTEIGAKTESQQNNRFCAQNQNVRPRACWKMEQGGQGKKAAFAVPFSPSTNKENVNPNTFKYLRDDDDTSRYSLAFNWQQPIAPLASSHLSLSLSAQEG
jgi:hypothetical protein